MRRHTDITDPRVIKALAHPLRVHILGLLEERTLSPSEIADEIGAPLGNVSYHVRQLAQLNLIKLVRKTPRRGAIEHHYRAHARPHVPDDAWGELPEIVKQAMVGARLGQLSQEINHAAASNGFNRGGSSLTRTPMRLDEEGYAELGEAINAFLNKADEIHAQASKRLAKVDHDGGGIAATLATMFFESVEVADATGTSSSTKRTRARNTAAGRRTQRATTAS
jgi:DNA-binding transcriptional ArsR family regulator